jgi:hypothetical protein
MNQQITGWSSRADECFSNLSVSALLALHPLLVKHGAHIYCEVTANSKFWS